MAGVVAGSRGIQIAGAVVIAVVLALVVGDRALASSAQTSWLSLARIGPRRDWDPDPKPEYIEEAGQPSEETWEREEREYREAQREREHD